MFHVSGLGAFSGLGAGCDTDPEMAGMAECTGVSNGGWTGAPSGSGTGPFNFPIGAPNTQTQQIALQQQQWNAQLQQLFNLSNQQRTNAAGTGIGLTNQTGSLNLNSPIIIAAGIGLALILLSRR